MKVSAKAEYACVAMLELAATYADNQPVRIKTIAEAQNIPPRFLVQILLQLKTAGLVTSVRGAAGGYQLSRSPMAISLADVLNAIEAIEDRSRAARSALADSPATSAVRILTTVWREIQEAEERMLRELTLAELLRRAQQTGALTYQI